jgi:ATP-binding cassette, subfamily G (WHITE), member 2, PDR
LLYNKANNIDHLRTCQVFDKVIVLYEGRPKHSGTRISSPMAAGTVLLVKPLPTFLTNPLERIAQEGWEGRVPRTPDEFARQWQESDERRHLLTAIRSGNQRFPQIAKHIITLGTPWL